MYCRKCGNPVSDRTLLCGRCGEPVVMGWEEPILKTNAASSFASTKPEPFFRKSWFIVVSLVLVWPVGLVLMWVFRKPTNKNLRVALTAIVLIVFISLAQNYGTAGTENHDVVEQVGDPIVAPIEEKDYGIDENNLAIGQTARYRNYEITLLAVDPYDNGERTLFEFEALESTSIKRDWFEGESFQRKNLDLDEALDSLEAPLPEKIELSKGDIVSGYVYFQGGGLSSVRFSGGILDSDRTWNFDHDDVHSSELSSRRYAESLGKFGFSAEEAEAARAFFGELGIEGCSIELSEPLFGTGIDGLQSFRTWIDINPDDPKDFHGSAFQHQINFTVENRQIFFVEITSFNVLGVSEDLNYVLFDVQQGGYLARYDASTDSVQS